MFNKKTSTQKIDESVAKSVNFELTIADMAKRSERRAWWVAIIAVVMALILLGGYFYMLPLKEKVPYLIMADAYTGTSTVARLNDDFTNRHLSTSEAINHSNVAHFLMARESYDSSMLNLGDWTTVQTMSSPGVKAAYTALFATNNPDNLYKTYGKDRALRVKLLSIVLIGGNGGQTTPKGATVRFQRSIYNKNSGVTIPLDSKIATLEFEYKTNLEMDDQSRIQNPLGFWVTDYRVDNDYASPAPGEVPGTAAPTSATQNPNQPDQAIPASSATAINAPASTNLAMPPQLGLTGQLPAAPASTLQPPSRNPVNGVGH